MQFNMLESGMFIHLCVRSMYVCAHIRVLNQCPLHFLRLIYLLFSVKLPSLGIYCRHY